MQTFLTPSRSPGRNHWPPDVGQTQPFRHQTRQLSDQVSASTSDVLEQEVWGRASRHRQLAPPPVQCRNWVMGGKTLSEQTFSELLQIADIIERVGNDRTARETHLSVRVSVGRDSTSNTEPRNMRYELADDKMTAIPSLLPNKRPARRGWMAVPATESVVFHSRESWREPVVKLWCFHHSSLLRPRQRSPASSTALPIRMMTARSVGCSLKRYKKADNAGSITVDRDYRSAAARRSNREKSGRAGRHPISPRNAAEKPSFVCPNWHPARSTK